MAGTRTQRAPKGRTSESGSRAVPRLGLNLALLGCVFAIPILAVIATETHLQHPVDPTVVRAEQDRAHQLVTLRSALQAVEETIFLRHMRTRLPRYVVMFKHEARRHDLAWHLLAAQAYQESRWNPRAVSPTGVRGIMMLTRNTSSAYGIENRHDPRASISGGARYFAWLMERVPPAIEEPDRTWVALAAYNVGLGHIHDARRLARQLGKDPNRWSDLREVLPLLAQKQYYRSLSHGYARGWEPVVYVKRIRAFEKLLRAKYPSPPPELAPQL